MRHLHIIYVDDEAPALENFESTMADCAQIKQLSFFLTAEDALSHAEAHPIDVAFLDIDLPRTTGFALYAQLKTMHPAMRVAFITGNIKYMSRRNQTVPAPYIFKPYREDELLAVLSDAE